MENIFGSQAFAKAVAHKSTRKAIPGRICMSMPILALLLGIVAPAAVTQNVPAAPEVKMYVPGGEAMKFWPRWRGPSGQGVVETGVYPDRWSATENVLWSVDVPGRGHSSPIVWDDKIFLTTASPDGGTRSILCYRRSNGKKLWQTDVREGKAVRNHQKNSYASGTPTTDGERIYAYFDTHGVICLDLDGNRVWAHQFEGLAHYHGFNGSPLLYRDRLIVYQDHQGPSGSFIMAFDKTTGDELWKTPRAPSDKIGWGSAIAIQAGDHDEIIVSSGGRGGGRVAAYDPATGKELWNCRGNSMEVIPTPVVGHGLVFASSGRVGPTLAIRPGGQGDVTESHLVWKISRGSPFVPSPLVYGDYLYMVNDMQSVATCLNAKTGELIWQEQLFEKRREAFSASLIGLDGKVFFTNDDGDTFVVKAGPEYELLHVNSLGEKALASPALVDGRWYWRTASKLICIGVSESDK